MRPCTGAHCIVDYRSKLVPQTCKAENCECRTELSDVDIQIMRAIVTTFPESAKEYAEQFNSYLDYMGSEL